MAKRLIINRYSKKKINTKSKGRNAGGWKKKKKSNKRPPDQDVIVYTYILKDLELDIFKIGKTTDPHGRFRSLCVRNKIVPVALVSKDVELTLHQMYKKNRTEHPDYKHNGGTEWFKRGGSFDEFIEGIEKKKEIIPHRTVHNMIVDLLEAGNMTISDSNTQWEISQSDYAYYIIGVEILRMLGDIRPTASGFETEKPNDIFIIGRKISVSEEYIADIMSRFNFYISDRASSGLIAEKRNKEKYGSRLRKLNVGAGDFDAEVYLLMNRVL